MELFIWVVGLVVFVVVSVYSVDMALSGLGSHK